MVEDAFWLLKQVGQKAVCHKAPAHQDLLPTTDGGVIGYCVKKTTQPISCIKNYVLNTINNKRKR